MANRRNSPFEQTKYEIAKEVGVTLNQGYNGDKTARENGSVGGRITQKVFEQYTGKNYRNQ